MTSLPRTRLPLVLGLAALALSWAPAGAAPKADAKKKGEGRSVSFDTSDGVKLQGTFYAAQGGKKDACVLLLHDTDPKKAKHSHTDGLDDFAQQLQKEGYAVLTFDFRGFGESKQVSEGFWKSPINEPLRVKVHKKKDLPESIDQKDFPPFYYPMLLNDVIAAKAYLDRKREANSANLVVIGCGEGATLGAMWMAAEWNLKRAPDTGFGQPTKLVDDPEGRDEAGAVWLNISTSLAGRPVPVKRWVMDVAGTHKVPMKFICGDTGKDKKGYGVAKDLLAAIKAANRKGTKLPFTSGYPVPRTSLTGAQLLKEDLGTGNWIIKKFLDPVIEKRGEREQKKDGGRDYYFWVVGGRMIRAKLPNEEVVGPISPALIGLMR